MENGRAKGKRERKTKKGDRKRPPSDVAMANAVDEPLYVTTSTPYYLFSFVFCLKQVLISE